MTELKVDYKFKIAIQIKTQAAIVEKIRAFSSELLRANRMSFCEFRARLGCSLSHIPDGLSTRHFTNSNSCSRAHNLWGELIFCKILCKNYQRNEFISWISVKKLISRKFRNFISFDQQFVIDFTKKKSSNQVMNSQWNDNAMNFFVKSLANEQKIRISRWISQKFANHFWSDRRNMTSIPQKCMPT